MRKEETEEEEELRNQIIPQLLNKGKVAGLNPVDDVDIIWDIIS